MQIMSFFEVFMILFENSLLCLEFVRILAGVFLQFVLTILFVRHVTVLDVKLYGRHLQLVLLGMSCVLGIFNL